MDWNAVLDGLDTPSKKTATGDYGDIINAAAKKYNVDPNYIRATIKAESNFNPKATSPAGANGLMQLMPATAAELGVKDPFDPEQNIMGGTNYLSQQMKTNNNDRGLSSAAYNAGPGNVKKHGGIPPFKETQDYVDRVGKYFDEYSGKSGGLKRASGKSEAWKKAFGYEDEKPFSWDDVISGLSAQEKSNDIQLSKTLKEGTKDLARNTLNFSKGSEEARNTGEEAEIWEGAAPAIIPEGDTPASRNRERLSKSLLRTPPTQGLLTPGMRDDIAQGMSIGKTPEQSLEQGKQKQIADLKTALDQKWLQPDGTLIRPDGFKGYVQDVLKMAPQIGAQIAATVAGGPVTGGAFMATQIGGSHYDELVKSGEEPERAFKGAVGDAIGQSILEQVGMGKALSFWKPGKTAVKILKGAGESGFVEWLTETLQKYPELAADIWVKGEGLSNQERVEQFIDGSWQAFKEGAYEGLVAAPFGALVGGVGAGFSPSVDDLTDKIADKQDIEDPNVKQAASDNIRARKKQIAKSIRDELKTRSNQDAGKIRQDETQTKAAGPTIKPGKGTGEKDLQRTAEPEADKQETKGTVPQETVETGGKSYIKQGDKWVDASGVEAKKIKTQQLNDLYDYNSLVESLTPEQKGKAEKAIMPNPVQAKRQEMRIRKILKKAGLPIGDTQKIDADREADKMERAGEGGARVAPTKGVDGVGKTEKSGKTDSQTAAKGRVPESAEIPQKEPATLDAETPETAGKKLQKKYVKLSLQGDTVSTGMGVPTKRVKTKFEVDAEKLYKGNTSKDLMEKDYNLYVGKGKNKRPAETLDELNKLNNTNFTAETWQVELEKYSAKASDAIDKAFDKYAETVNKKSAKETDEGLLNRIESKLKVNGKLPDLYKEYSAETKDDEYLPGQTYQDVMRDMLSGEGFSKDEIGQFFKEHDDIASEVSEAVAPKNNLEVLAGTSKSGKQNFNNLSDAESEQLNEAEAAGLVKKTEKNGKIFYQRTGDLKAWLDGLKTPQKPKKPEAQKEPATLDAAKETEPKLSTRHLIPPERSEGKSSGLKSRGDGLSSDIKPISDFFQSATFQKKGFSGFNIPAQRAVFSSVISAIHQPEIYNSIIKFIPVDVVDNLVGIKRTSKVMFHDKAVNKNPIFTTPDGSISVDTDLASSLTRQIALAATKSKFGRGGVLLDSGDRFPANDTFFTENRSTIDTPASVGAEKKPAFVFPDKSWLSKYGLSANMATSIGLGVDIGHNASPSVILDRISDVTGKSKEEIAADYPDLTKQAKPKTGKEKLKAAAEKARGTKTPRRMLESGRAGDGKVLKPGDIFLTNTGRETTPFPKQKMEKYHSQWIIDNAVGEAKSRGADFQAKLFGRIRVQKGGTLIQGDSDSMMMYLFGDKVIMPAPKMTRPLVTPTKETKEPWDYLDTTHPDAIYPYGEQFSGGENLSAEQIKEYHKVWIDRINKELKFARGTETNIHGIKWANKAEQGRKTQQVKKLIKQRRTHEKALKEIKKAERYKVARTKETKKAKAPRKKRVSKGPQTIRGTIKAMGGINFVNMKGELKDMPVDVKYLHKKTGVPYDLVEKSLKAEGWMYEDESILEALQDKEFLKRRALNVDALERKAHLTEAEKQFKKDLEREPESPPEGNYVRMKAEDLPGGKKITIIDGNSTDGWDTYEVIDKDAFGVTLKDGVVIELSPLDEVEVLVDDIKNVPGVAEKQMEMFTPTTGQLDMFGGPPKQAVPEKKRAKRKPKEAKEPKVRREAQIDLFTGKAKPIQKDLFKPFPKKTPKLAKAPKSNRAGNLSRGTIMHTTGYIRGPSTVAKSVGEVASLVAHIRKDTQENIFVVTTDKDGKILEIHQYGRGTKSSGNVHSIEVAGHVLNIPEAHTVYVAHNHPSGDTVPSQPDLASMEVLSQIVELKGIKFKALIIAGDGYRQFDSGAYAREMARRVGLSEINFQKLGAETEEDRDFSANKYTNEPRTKLTPVSRTKSLPVKKRGLRPNRFNGKTIDNPDDIAKIVKSDYGGKDGFVFLGTKLNILGFMPFPSGMSVKDAATEFIQTAENTNAAGYVLHINDPLASSLGRVGFISALSQNLDSILKLFDIVENGNSYASSGRLGIISLGPTPFSRLYSENALYSVKPGNPLTGLTRDHLKKIFHWADSARTLKDGSILITKGPRQFKINQVNHIAIDRASFELGYRRKPTLEELTRGARGAYQDGVITLSNIADIGTVAHESQHYLEASGLINKSDVKAICRAIGDKNATEEQRAEWIEANVLARDQKGRIGKLIQKVFDFVDSLINLVHRTARGVVRDIESGKAFTDKQSPVFEFAQAVSYSLSKATKNILDNPNFVKWFGNSKVSDSDGNPLVVYHGTPDADTNFSIFEGPDSTGWFSEDPKLASDVYTGAEIEGGGVLPVYLSVKNPLDLTGIVNVDQRTTLRSVLDAKNIKYDIDEIEKSGGSYSVDEFDNVKLLWEILNDRATEGVLSSLGFDGVKVEEKGATTWSIFNPNQVKSIYNRGTYSKTNDDIMYQKLADRWYSQMEQSLEKKLPGRGTPEQLSQMVQGWAKKGEFKADELSWSGLNDWLAEQTGKVTKAEVMAYLAENRLGVQEVVKADVTVKPEDQVDVFGSRTTDEWRKYLADNNYLPETEVADASYGEIRDIVYDEIEIGNITAANAEPVGHTKFSQYQEPGGENYKELLITLPERGPKLPETTGDYAQMLFNKSFDELREDQVDKVVAQMRVDDNSLKRKNRYKGPHYEEPNILSHVRFNERTDADGNRVLFLEEIQSDQAQDYRKQLKNIEKVVANDFKSVVRSMVKAGVLKEDC